MTPLTLKDAHARSESGSKTKFYPLVNKHGKVVEFPETTATEILAHVNAIREVVPHPDSPDSSANKNDLNTMKLSTRHFVDGWRPLTDQEYTFWKDNGMQMFIDAVKEAIVPASMLQEKEDEIASLRAKLAALEAGQKAVKVKDVQPVIPGTEGGKA